MTKVNVSQQMIVNALNELGLDANGVIEVTIKPRVVTVVRATEIPVVPDTPHHDHDHEEDHA